MQHFSLPSQLPRVTDSKEVIGEAACILLIEDSAADARLVREALEEHVISCKLTVITNGEAAIEYIQAVDAGDIDCPTLIILDLNLPKKPGKDVLKHIRASPKCKNVTIAVLSSSDSQKDREDTAKLGASLYIRKPSRLNDFLALGSVFKHILAAPSQ